MPALTPELVLDAYRQGAFPMARSEAGPIEFYTAEPRAVLPLDDRFHVRRSLARILRKEPFTLTRDHAFEAVIRQCAQPRPKSPGTWINPQIIDLYTQLHHQGHAHSIEAWSPDPNPAPDTPLLGGLYGIALGGAFFAESMFSASPYASQACLVHLVEHLRQRGFTLLDVQFNNPHLQQFGTLEIPSQAYLDLLQDALGHPASFS